jgi:hypothetical protein
MVFSLLSYAQAYLERIIMSIYSYETEDGAGLTVTINSEILAALEQELHSSEKAVVRIKFTGMR